MIYLSVCSGIEAATVKRCPRCNETKALEDFHRQPSGKHGRFSYCKPCSNQYYRGNRKRNYSTEQKRRWQVKTRYRISVSDVEAMVSAQGGRCGLCDSILGDRYHIDHDHLTRKVRGILCHRCNVTIGGLDDPAFQAKVIAWLARGR